MNGIPLITETGDNMYEIDFTGWIRTPEELERLKTDWKYRWYMNWRKFFKAIKYKRYWQFWYLFKSAIINERNW